MVDKGERMFMRDKRRVEGVYEGQRGEYFMKDKRRVESVYEEQGNEGIGYYGGARKGR